jgi:hypothetical protein
MSSTDKSFSVTPFGDCLLQIHHPVRIRVRRGVCSYCDGRDEVILLCDSDNLPTDDIMCVGCFAATAETILDHE